METCTLRRMRLTMRRIISLSCSMWWPSAYSVPSASNVISFRPSADECTYASRRKGGNRAQPGGVSRCQRRLRPSTAVLPHALHAPHCVGQAGRLARRAAQPTCAILRMWRSSAKFGCKAAGGEGVWARGEKPELGVASLPRGRATDGRGSHTHCGCKHALCAASWIAARARRSPGCSAGG